MFPLDQIHNDDGVWLRLNAETIKEYCNSSHLEAWCLQYNQHLGKTLLLPVEEPKSILDQVIKETILRKRPDTSDEYVKTIDFFFATTSYFNAVACRKRKTVTFDAGRSMIVVKCGASGHNIRSKPSLKGAPIGMLALGNTVTVEEYVS